MDRDLALKLQACHDGELPAPEARQLQSQLAENDEAQALLAEWETLRGALQDFEQTVKLPESREFYWSKIGRDIESRQAVAAPRSAFSWPSRWRRWLLPVGAVSAALLAGFFSLRQFGIPSLERGPEVEASVADPGAFTYRDYNTGTTLVWLSYPADNDRASNSH